MRRVFIVTGVCQAGASITLPLVDFLNNGVDYVLAWIDFKDETGRVACQSLAAESAGRIVLARAPRAIWGGSSIVRSMMEAMLLSLSTWPDWEQVIFCSSEDVPLLGRHAMGATLDQLGAYDYCGSKWNNTPGDLLRPIPPGFILTQSQSEPSIEFRIRSEMSILLDPALRPAFTDDLIRSMRLCNNLFERYFVTTSEWFRPGGLTIARMTAERAAERGRFFQQFGLYSGRQWCVLSRSFAATVVDAESREIFQRWFSDILIPDESFFQTLAHHHAVTTGIKVLWRNLHYSDAANFAVTRHNFAEIIAAKDDRHVFVRKRVQSFTFEEITTMLAGS